VVRNQCKQAIIRWINLNNFSQISSHWFGDSIRKIFPEGSEKFSIKHRRWKIHSRERILQLTSWTGSKNNFTCHGTCQIVRTTALLETTAQPCLWL
jgi:hypothetical protein